MESSHFDSTQISVTVDHWRPHNLGKRPEGLGKQMKLLPGETKMEAFARIKKFVIDKGHMAYLAPILDMTAENFMKKAGTSYEAHMDHIASWLRKTRPSIKSVRLSGTSMDFYQTQFAKVFKTHHYRTIDPTSSVPADLIIIDWGTSSAGVDGAAPFEKHLSRITLDDINKCKKLAREVLVLFPSVSTATTLSWFGRTATLAPSTLSGTPFEETGATYYEATHLKYSFVSGDPEKRIREIRENPPPQVQHLPVSEYEGWLPPEARAPMKPLTPSNLHVLPDCIAKFKTDGVNIFRYSYMGGLYYKTSDVSKEDDGLKHATKNVFRLDCKTSLPPGLYQFEEMGSVKVFNTCRLAEKNHTWSQINDMIKADPTLATKGYVNARTLESLNSSDLRNGVGSDAEEGWVFILDNFDMEQFYYKSIPTVDLTPDSYESLFKKKAPAPNVAEYTVDGHFIKNRFDKFTSNPPSQVRDVFTMYQLTPILVEVIFNSKMYSRVLIDSREIQERAYFYFLQRRDDLNGSAVRATVESFTGKKYNKEYDLALGGNLKDLDKACSLIADIFSDLACASNRSNEQLRLDLITHNYDVEYLIEGYRSRSKKPKDGKKVYEDISEKRAEGVEFLKKKKKDPDDN